MIAVKDENPKLKELPYIRYALIDEQPMLLGMTGRDQAIYGRNLTVELAPPPP
jgi:hypothetical protein